MKKRYLVLIALIFSMSFVVAESENENVPSLLSEIKEVLQGILEKLNLIAEKETNIIVEPNITIEQPEIVVNPNITIEPPVVNVEAPIVNVDAIGMSKRGNIVLKQYGLYGSGYKEETSTTQFVALPNGVCNIIVTTDCGSCELSQAKDLNVVKNQISFWGSKSTTFEVDNEYYMIRIKPLSSGSYSEMYVTYNCI